MQISESLLTTHPVSDARTEALSQRVRTNDDIKSVAQNFESVLVSLLLKEMRKTTGGDGLFAGDASDSYGGLFDLYMGQHLADSGGLGIAQMIEVYLGSSHSP